MYDILKAAAVPEGGRPNSYYLTSPMRTDPQTQDILEEEYSSQLRQTSPKGNGRRIFVDL